MSDNHTKFLSLLKESRDAVWTVGRWLSSEGFSVTIEPTRYAPTRDDWQEYSDGGDLFIKRRVEVKRLTVNFTCAADWPFGSKFIVCSKGSYDRATPKPIAYYILSQDMSHVAIAKCRDSHLWTVEQRTDSRFENHTQEFYFCPMKLVTFTRVRE